MYLVPYICRAITADFYQVWILLERNGTHLMSVETVEEASAFAIENGLTIRSQYTVDDTLYIEIAITVALADFYTWSDVSPGQQPMREVWRPFIWMTSDMSCNKGLEMVELGATTVANVLLGLRLLH